MSEKTAEKTCGECKWWVRNGDAPLWGRCAPVRHNCPAVTIGGGRPPCPAFDDGEFKKAVRELADIMKRFREHLLFSFDVSELDDSIAKVEKMLEEWK